MKSSFFLFLSILFFSMKGFSQDIFIDDAQRQAAFQLVLSDELREIYDHIFDSAEKEKWEQKYWKIFDPTPGNEKNEIYEEFVDRFLYAKKYYSNLIAPLLLDDRGKYYLKFGAPGEKITSMGVGKPYRDNETWAYYRFNLFLDFVNQIGFGYREVPSLLDAITTGPSNLKTPIAANLYVERETLHQRYMSFNSIVDGTAGPMSESLFYQLTGQIGNEKKISLESAPPSDFEFSYDEKRLDAQISSAVFRGNYDQSRVELYYSFPLKHLKFKTGDIAPFESIMEMQFTLFNVEFEKIMQREEKLKLFARTEDEIKKRIYINQHTEELPAGIYNLSFQLESPQSKRIAILRAQLQVRDFATDTLMMSDIQFSPQIREGMQNARNLKPNGIQVVPYIGSVVRRTNPIAVYFELYNLKLNENAKNRFNISYEIRSLAGEQSNALTSAIQFISHLVGGNSEQQTIGSSFESEGNNEFQQIYLSIDFSKFATGPCALNISVTDLISGSRVNGQKRFVLK